MPYIGRLGAMGLGKESPVGTVTTPTEFIPIHLPDSVFPSIALLEHTGIRGLPDKVTKATQGPGDVKGLKIKWDVEAENIGNLLMGIFGTDTFTEGAQFTVGASNKYIDFKESGGSELHATIATGTYKMGTSGATAGTLCAAIKTALQSAGAGTYTITYSYSTKKMTIAIGTGTVQILWLSGTNNANGAYSLLGWTKADTSAAASLTSDSTTGSPWFSHTYTRLANAQLPSYTLWVDKGGGAKYIQAAGCMVSKVDLDIKNKEFITVDTEWTGLSYDDTGAIQSVVISSLNPFKWSMAAVSVDSTPNLNYDNIKLTFNNDINSDHAISGSIWPTKIYSKGFEVTFAMDLVMEDTTQYAKFLSGSSAALIFTLTHTDNISGTSPAVKYSITINLPYVYYTAAPIPNPDGLLKINFTGRAVYNVGTAYTANVVLVNTKSSTY